MALLVVVTDHLPMLASGKDARRCVHAEQVRRDGGGMDERLTAPGSDGAVTCNRATDLQDLGAVAPVDDNERTKDDGRPLHDEAKLRHVGNAEWLGQILQSAPSDVTAEELERPCKGRPR